MESLKGSGPLAGVSVLEIAGIAAAPFGVMMLADMGAEVIRVDRIPSGEKLRFHPRTDVLNRGRRSIAVNMKAPGGVAVVRRLASQVDVFVEGFRPGVMERLGLGPGELIAANPRLVYARMTGWGQEGPLAHRAGHDINYIGLTGTLHGLGPKDAPPLPPLNLVGDSGGGGMYLAFGVVCAVLEAHRSGKGQVLDAAMVDGAASLTSLFYSLTASGVWQDQRGSNRLDGGAPHYGAYETLDGKYMAVGSLEPKFYKDLLKGLGLEGAELPRADNKANWRTLRERFAAIFRTRTRAEWEGVFCGTDSCVTPVRSLSEASADPHLAARGTIVEAGGVTQAAPAPRLSRTPGALGKLPPFPGEHSEEVLADYGFGEQERADLLSKGTVVKGASDY